MLGVARHQLEDAHHELEKERLKKTKMEVICYEGAMFFAVMAMVLQINYDFLGEG